MSPRRSRLAGREWPVLQACGRRHKKSDPCRHCAREELRLRNVALRKCADEAEAKGDHETAAVLRELAEANEASLT